MCNNTQKQLWHIDSFAYANIVSFLEIMCETLQTIINGSAVHWNNIPVAIKECIQYKYYRYYKMRLMFPAALQHSGTSNLFKQLRLIPN